MKHPPLIKPEGFSAQDMNLYHESYGAGQPLIILHGLFGSLDNWRTLSGRFGRHYRVFAVDLRNHGRSPHSEACNYELMAEDLRIFMDAHSIRSACLLGHSMGGKAAMQFAVTWPDRVEKLVIVDIAPKDYPPHHVEIIQSLISLDLKAYKGRTDIDGALKTSIPDQATRQFLLKNLVRDDAGFLRWKINLQAIAKNYCELIKGLDTDRSFKKATLFLKGQNSQYIRQEDFAKIARLFPRAELVTIPGAAHWVQADAPAEFLRVVLDFLQSS